MMNATENIISANNARSEVIVTLKIFTTILNIAKIILDPINRINSLSINGLLPK